MMAMTESTPRERLVKGARSVFHRQGVEKTTIANVAEEAGIPLGNIYYHFKTKNQLVLAVIESQSHERDDVLAELDRRRTPAARLKAFIREIAQSETIARYGCPFGSLISELDKRDDETVDAGRGLINPFIDWAESQFGEMGCADARDLAVELIATYEGLALLTNTYRDPTLMSRHTRRLERWIDSLDRESPAHRQGKD